MSLYSSKIFLFFAISSEKKKQIIYARAYTYEHQHNLLLGLAAKMAEEPFRLLVHILPFILDLSFIIYQTLQESYLFRTVWILILAIFSVQ